MAGRISKAAFPKPNKGDPFTIFRAARDELLRRAGEMSETERWTAQGMALGIMLQQSAADVPAARDLVVDGLDLAIELTAEHKPS